MNIRPSYLLVTAVLAVCQACAPQTTSADVEAETLTVPDSVVKPEASVGSEASEGESLTDAPYLIADDCAGPFRLGTPMPERIEGFAVTSIEAEADAAPHRRPGYICEIGNEGWVRITPLPHPDGGTDDIIGEIFVYSDLFVTDKGIGAMSTAEDFAEAYPDLHISRSADCGLYIFETPQLRNVHFLLKAEFYAGQGCDSDPAGEPAPTISDFKPNSCFSAIVIGQRPEYDINIRTI